MSKQNTITRRQFVKAAGTTAAAFSIVPRNVLGGQGNIAPSEMINHASIGAGGMGTGDLVNIQNHKRAQIVAICDVDKIAQDRLGLRAPAARKYTDWREMFAIEGDKIDSVNVTVPDHMHSVITIAALEAGKHVYCQKPLCHDVAECRAVATAAKKSGKVTQLGNHAASGFGDQMAVQYLRNGVLGRIKKIVACSNRPGIEHLRPEGPRPDKTDAVPDTLDWNLWLSTAPERPFVKGVYHPGVWRGWQDFGTSWLGDIGCHVFDFWWKGLDMTAPKSVIAKVQQSWLDSPKRRADNWPQSQHITWTFDGNKASGGKEFTVEWFDGSMKPSEEYQVLAKAAGFKSFTHEGAMVIGEKGAMMVPNASMPRFSPSAKFKGIARPKTVKRDHYQQYVDACVGNGKTTTFFEQTGPMTECILLGTVAARVPNTKLEWDPQKMDITNVPEARKYLSRTYRKGW